MMQSKDQKMMEQIVKELDKRIKTALLDRRSHNKRPARLLPARILQGERKNDTNDQPDRRFYGPPSSCSDLSSLGYTLNGFYLIKPPEDKNIEDMTKLETVFCSFRQKQVAGTYYDSSKVETRKGHYLKLYSDDSPPSDGLTINFHVERPSPPSIETGSNNILLFTRIHSNLGKGFMIENSISGHYFAAPKSGLYHFVYRGFLFFVPKDEALNRTIHVCLNDDVIESTLITVYQLQQGRNSVRLTIQATLKLDVGDRIHLKWNKTNGNNNKVHLGNYWFKGYLVREMN